jgi:tripartite-type tricarboxylate transporter receptor subunit TctC
MPQRLAQGQMPMLCCARPKREERMVGRIAGALALIVVTALPIGAGAQSWPQKPIRLVVPFPAGGPADFFGRGLSNTLKKHIDQPVVIDNRSGAAGVAGADNVAKSAADG